MVPVLGISPGVLAHQGGWDEILLFVAPVVLAIVAVRWAERRARARRAASPAESGDRERAVVAAPDAEDPG